MIIDRRAFLVAMPAAVGGFGRLSARAQAPRLETFTDWMNASRAARQAGVQASLDRIRAMDASIHAWVQVAPQVSAGNGPLADIPYGAKDIIETRGLATEYGSAVYKGRLGTDDAAIVRMLRQRGAVMLGKTQTTWFAYRTPAPTRNPRNLEHTPGGSSSGSAAAVAAGMIPFALGTQTRGSILRPASFCGITGFKPTYGTLPLDGVMEFARSLDTLGPFTHTPADMIALWQALGYTVGPAEDVVLGVPDPMPDVEPAMAAAFRDAVAALQRAGMRTRPVNIASLLTTLDAAAITVMFYEGARAHEERYKTHGKRLLDLADLVEQGLQLSADRYDEAREHIADGRARFADIYQDTPVILVPAATGPAPRGLSTTGDPRMNAPWTALGTPAISIPLPVPGLPLGLQLTARSGQDSLVLRTAERAYRLLHT